MKWWHITILVLFIGGAFFLGRNTTPKSTGATNYVETQLEKTKDSLRNAGEVILHQKTVILESEKRDSVHRLDMQEQEYRIQRRESKNRKLQRDYDILKNTKFNGLPIDSLDRIISEGRKRLNHN